MTSKNNTADGTVRTQRNRLTVIGDMKKDTWATLVAEVEQLWDVTSETMRQVGLLRDGTGIIKFVSWEKSELPIMVVGKTYYISGAPVSEFNDRLSIGLVKTTEVKEL